MQTYTIKRISTVPGSPLKVSVDQPSPDSPDAGFTVGGSFMFYPAGEDGDTAAVSEHAAGVIMSDPGLSVHFECSPPWKPKKAAVEPSKESTKDKGTEGKK